MRLDEATQNLQSRSAHTMAGLTMMYYRSTSRNMVIAFIMLLSSYITAQQTDSSTNLPSSTGDSQSVDVSVSLTSNVDETTAYLPSSTITPSATTTPNPVTTPGYKPTPTPAEPTEWVLNTSDAYAPYWVRTVLKVPTNIDVKTASYRTRMETEFASLYDEAIHRLASILNGTFVYKKRRKRAVTVGNATIQMTNITRADLSEPSHTTFLYYLIEDDPENNVTAGDRTVGLMELFSDQEVAIRIGYEVVVKAEMYVPLTPPEGKRLWIIGAVIGSVIGAVVIVWCIMFTYFKCTRPPPNTPRSPRNPNKVADMDQLEYRTGKDIKGFDYVRTEVGMENELDKQKVPDYYRRYPMGSSELEGMYSPGDSPPPPFRGHRPSTGSQQGTQPQKSKTDKIGDEPSYPPPAPPINGFIAANTENQNKAAPRKKTAGKKKKSKEHHAPKHTEDQTSVLSTEPSESSETTGNTDQTEQKHVLPQRKGHRRKPSSKSSRDSVTSEESEQMSKKKKVPTATLR